MSNENKLAPILRTTLKDMLREYKEMYNRYRDGRESFYEFKDLLENNYMDSGICYKLTQMSIIDADDHEEYLDFKELFNDVLEDCGGSINYWICTPPKNLKNADELSMSECLQARIDLLNRMIKRLEQ